MNPEQKKSAIRSVLVALGGIAVGAGWLSSDQAAILGSENTIALIGIIASAGAAVWGLFAHKQANAVAVVAAMPEVAQVQTAPTIAGDILAAAVGSTPDAVVRTAPLPSQDRPFAVGPR